MIFSWREQFDLVFTFLLHKEKHELLYIDHDFTMTCGKGVSGRCFTPFFKPRILTGRKDLPSTEYINDLFYTEQELGGRGMLDSLRHLCYLCFPQARIVTCQEFYHNLGCFLSRSWLLVFGHIKLFWCSNLMNIECVSSTEYIFIKFC